MLNNKYDNETLIPITFFIIIGVLFVFLKAYDIILKVTAKEIVQSIESDYDSRISSGEKLNINSLLIGYQSFLLDSYQKKVEPFRLRYELFEHLTFNTNHLEVKGYPSNFNEFNRDTFKVLSSDLSLNTTVRLIGRKLEISSAIESVINPIYRTQGNWAIYFNDKLQYSSDFFITKEGLESIGKHYFTFKFSENKDIYLRIVYKFKNINSKAIEYYVDERLISIKK